MVGASLKRPEDPQEHPAPTPTKPPFEKRWLYAIGALILLVVIAHACGPKTVVATGSTAPPAEHVMTYEDWQKQKDDLAARTAHDGKMALISKDNATNTPSPTQPPPPVQTGYYPPETAQPDNQQRLEEERKRREDALHSLGVVSFRKEPPTGVEQKVAATPNAPVDLQPVSTQEPEDDKGKYRILEGTIIPCTLENRLNGAYAGPVKCLIANDIYARDHEHLLIPQGAEAIGEVSQVNGSTQRLFVAFHRIILPNGESISLDQFKGLNQIGETGLIDRVNHHYMQIFGASAAIAALSGLAEIGNYGGGSYSPSGQYRAGITQSLSQSSMQVLEKFLSILPTFTIGSGSRIKIWVSNDLKVPEYVKKVAN